MAGEGVMIGVAVAGGPGSFGGPAGPPGRGEKKATKADNSTSGCNRALKGNEPAPKVALMQFGDVPKANRHQRRIKMGEVPKWRGREGAKTYNKSKKNC